MPTPPHSIGLLTHPKKPESLVLAGQMEEFLRARGCSVWTGSAWDESEAVAHVAGLDLLITLGGDGTILRAARIAGRGEASPLPEPAATHKPISDETPGSDERPCGDASEPRYGVPILGVKLGRVSFLAEVPPDDWQQPLELLLDGRYWLEERMLLDVAVARNTNLSTFRPDHCYVALNDVVIARGSLARLIIVDAWVDNSYLTTYRADGVIVSTPTGCTGYALAAGGPILPPELRNILLIPICPHLSLDRPVVLSQGATVRLEVHADYPAILTVDGQFEITLADGDRVEVRASQHVSQFVHMQDRVYFYRTLMERLRW